MQFDHLILCSTSLFPKSMFKKNYFDAFFTWEKGKASKLAFSSTLLKFFAIVLKVLPCWFLSTTKYANNFQRKKKILVFVKFFVTVLLNKGSSVTAKCKIIIKNISSLYSKFQISIAIKTCCNY